MVSRVFDQLERLSREGAALVLKLAKRPHEPLAAFFGGAHVKHTPVVFRVYALEKSGTLGAVYKFRHRAWDEPEGFRELADLQGLSRP